MKTNLKKSLQRVTVLSVFLFLTVAPSVLFARCGIWVATLVPASTTVSVVPNDPVTINYVHTTTIVGVPFGDMDDGFNYWSAVPYLTDGLGTIVATLPPIVVYVGECDDFFHQFTPSSIINMPCGLASGTYYLNYRIISAWVVAGPTQPCALEDVLLDDKVIGNNLITTLNESCEFVCDNPLGTGLPCEIHNIVQLNYTNTVSTISSVNATPSTINCGESSTLSVTGSAGLTYSWSPASTVSPATGAVVVASPITTTSYTVVGTDGYGCPIEAFTTADVVVIPIPIVVIASSTLLSCGESATLTASGADSYTWAPPVDLSATTGDVVVAYPIVSTIYTVTGTNSNGCTNTATSTIASTVIEPGCSTGSLNPTGMPPTYTSTPGCFDHSSQWGSSITGIMPPTGFPYGTNFTTFSINGTFYIDNDFSFFLMKLNMGPNAKIEILPTCTLNLQSCYIKACADYMWDGIYIDGPTAHLGTSVITPANIAVIQDAKNAVVSVSGGDFNLMACIFDRNYKGIVVSTYAGAHTGTVKNCTFSSDFFSSGVNLLAPYSTLTRSYIGIDLRNVGSISIGDGTFFFGNNFFDDLDYGIKASNVNLTVMNGTFTNITSPFGCGPMPACCLSAGSPCTDPCCTGDVPGWAIWLTDGGSLTAGGTGTYEPNTVSKCTNGFGVQEADATIKYNHFADMSPLSGSLASTAVRISSCSYNKIEVSLNAFERITNGIGGFSSGDCSPFYIYGNSFENFNYGVSLNNIINSNLIVGSNTFNTGDIVKSQGSTAISMTYANTVSPFINMIRDNTIYNVQTGIHVINSAKTGSAEILNNTINFNNFYNYTPNFIYGIRLEHCANTICLLNDISESNYSDVTWYGISAESSDNILTYSNNRMTNMGTAIRFMNGVAASAKTSCNQFNNYWWRGVALVNANVGTQGSSSYVPGNPYTGPTYNSWAAAVASANDAYAVTTVFANKWFDIVNNLPECPLNQFSSNLGIPNPILCTLSTTSATTSSCYKWSDHGSGGDGTSHGLAKADQGTLASILRKDEPFNTLGDEIKYQSLRMIYAALDDDASLMHQGTQDDQVLQDFYDGNQNTNIGKFCKVQKLISQSLFDDAVSLNASLKPDNTLETKEQTVSSIYLATWVKGIHVFTEDQESALEAIAYGDPLKDGPAVHDARALLGLNLDDGENTPQARMAKPNGKHTTVDPDGLFNIYPNPNNGTMKIDYVLQSGQKGELCIRDIVGRTLASYELPETFSAPNEIEKGSFSIDQSVLKAGVYLYDFKVDGVSVNTGKIAIIK